MHEDSAAGRVQRIVQPSQVAWLVKNVEQRIEAVSHLYRGCLALGSQFIAMPARYEFADLAHIAFPLAGRSGAAAMALAGALR
jgi:hypothetical protein